MSYVQTKVDSRGRRVTLEGMGAAGPSSAPDMSFSLSDPDVAAAAAVSAVIANPTAIRNRTAIAAVRDFQSAYGHGLSVDGIYGPATRSALLAVTGRSDLPAPPGSSTSSGGSSLPSSVPGPSDLVPEAMIGGTPSWVVPALAVTGVAVIGIGAVAFMRRRRAPVKTSVKANRRRNRRRSRRS